MDHEGAGGKSSERPGSGAWAAFGWQGLVMVRRHGHTPGVTRTERLFAIAEHLRSRRTGVTAEALATRFDVSVRTIYRDLDTLRAAHLPLNAEPGPGGGYALDRSYTLPPVNFTVHEATLLLMTTEWIGRQRFLPFVDTLEDAAAKVRATLPSRTRAAVARRSETLSFVGVPARPVPPSVRSAVEEAWLDDRPLDIVYDGAIGRTRRRVRIRNVTVDRAETRLNCDDLDKGEPRQFVLDRIAEAVLVPVGLAPPDAE